MATAQAICEQNLLQMMGYKLDGKAREKATIKSFTDGIICLMSAPYIQYMINGEKKELLSLKSLNRLFKVDQEMEEGED